MKVLAVRCTLRDAHGSEIETTDVPLVNVALYIGRFVRIHGGSGDCGSVEFEPVYATPDAPREREHTNLSL